MSCGDVSGAVHIHHINHDSRDNDLKNLMVLCKKCHSVWHTKNGKSIVVPSHLVRFRAINTRNNFDIKYRDKGGTDTLIDMAVTQGYTLQKMGDHFGVSREYIRQLLYILGIRKGKNTNGGEYDINTRSAIVERKLKNLYRWIIENDMLIGEFATKSGISPTRISGILTGKKIPNYDDLSKIKIITGLSFEEILGKGNPTT